MYFIHFIRFLFISILVIFMSACNDSNSSKDIPQDQSIISTLKNVDCLEIHNGINNNIQRPKIDAELQDIDSIACDGKYWSSYELNTLFDYAEIKSINLNNSQFEDINDLKKFIGLDWLSLRNNKISDIRFISTMSNLVYLDLAYNKISDLTILMELDKLSYLNLSHNPFNDIHQILNFNRTMEELNLSYTTIKDDQSLSSIKARLLILQGLNINDKSLFLKTIPEPSTEYELSNGVYSTLDLSHNNISDISIFSRKYIKNLILDYNKIINLNISNLELNSISLANNQISDLTPLAQKNSISNINLANNKIKNLSPLNTLDSIYTLILDGNPINEQEFSTIKPELLKNISNLSLANLNLKNIDFLKNLRETTDEDLRKADIFKERYKESLNLSDNKIKDVSALYGINFRELNLSNNYIENVSPLSTVSLLPSGAQYVCLYNPIYWSTISFCESRINISNNCIKEVKPLTDNIHFTIIGTDKQNRCN